MGKNSYLLPVMLVFFVLYFFLFPHSVREEYILVPERKIVLDGDPSPVFPGISGDWAFSSPDKMGYYDGETGAVTLLDGGGRSRISDRFYMEDGEGRLSLLSKTGELVTPLDTPLVPALFEDHFFLADFLQGYIREIDAQGREIWDYTLPAMITCLDNKNGLTAVGLLNGEVYLFDGTGAPVFTWKPGGSRIDVIYGITLSEEGSRLALVSGLEPQRFILLEEKENGYRPVFHENLSQSFRKPLSLAFDDSLNVIVEGAGKGLYYTPGCSSLSSFGIYGDFADSGAFSGDGTVLFLSRYNEKAVLSVFTENGEKIAEHHYDDDPWSMDVRENRILLSGRDNAYVFRREFH